MKEYRVCLLDFSKGNGKIIFTKYADGLRNARAIYPDIKAHFSRNAGCFTGWKDGKNLIICECGTASNVLYKA